MIAVSGLPEADRYTRQAADDAFAAYRSPDNRDALLAALAAKYGNRGVMIRLIGVWDTVGALGIPGGLFANLDQDIYGFLDTNLHPNIQTAYQALAIDERRREFAPTLWNPISTEGQELDQVWFAGVHSDVGGGYAETDLSDITLGWMMKKAAASGVAFDPSLVQQYTHLNAKGALGEMHNSWDMLWGIPVTRYIPLGSSIADSVAMRVQGLPAYCPANLPKGFPGDLGGMEIEPIYESPTS